MDIPVRWMAHSFGQGMEAVVGLDMAGDWSELLECVAVAVSDSAIDYVLEKIK